MSKTLETIIILYDTSFTFTYAQETYVIKTSLVIRSTFNHSSNHHNSFQVAIKLAISHNWHHKDCNTCTVSPSNHSHNINTSPDDKRSQLDKMSIAV